jgi:putative flippase GtrA
VSSVRRLAAAGDPSRQTVIRAVSLLRTDGVLAQGVRFAITGVVVSLVYISVTTVLAEVWHLRFEVALAIGWCTAVGVHFTLQRVFVWTHREGFALPLGRQVRRYLMVAGSQLGITAATTTVLPSVLGLPTEVVYLATAMLLTSINFLVFRGGVFHAPAASVDSA